MRSRAVAKAALVAVAVFLIVLAALHPGVERRSHLLSRKIRGERPIITWTELMVRMAPSFLRPSLRSMVGPNPPSWVEKLDFPVDQGEAWSVHPIFDGPTVCLKTLDCHASVLQAGEMPHPPHQHVEEELIVPLSGEVDIIRVDSATSKKQTAERITPGQFIYHAAHQTHTIRSVGPHPATYLVFKWAGEPAELTRTVLTSSTFAFEKAHQLQSQAPEGFATTRIFEGPTLYLETLHCHATTLKPGAGYDPHSDPYDVAIILLSGVVETLDRRVEPKSVIFYPADTPHGMKNIGAAPAKYVVFEFHG